MATLWCSLIGKKAGELTEHESMDCSLSTYTDAFVKETETEAQHHSQLVKRSCNAEQKAQEDSYPHHGDSCCLVSNGLFLLKLIRLFLQA